MAAKTSRSRSKHPFLLLPILKWRPDDQHRILLHSGVEAVILIFWILQPHSHHQFHRQHLVDLRQRCLGVSTPLVPLLPL